MNGVLVVDKPSGPTSHDVVGRVRRALNTRRVGHTGTLDPLASGVLPLVIGRATRLAQFLSSDDKEYVADVRFGISTTTYDALGVVTETESRRSGGPVAVDAASLSRALDEFRGTYSQMPPAFSAKKVAGRPAYELARAGQTPDLKAVEVTVSALEVVEQAGDVVRLRLTCSSGFYVRTLAHELGQRLGCGAHLAALRRTRAGTFLVGDAVPLAEVEAAGAAAASRLVPLDRLLPDFQGVVLTAEGVRRALHGNVVPAGEYGTERPASGPRVRLLDEAGGLLGIAEPAGGGVLHPVIVLV
jgi:tRNA pseudouridine55 synthase